MRESVLPLVEGITRFSGHAFLPVSTPSPINKSIRVNCGYFDSARFGLIDDLPLFCVQKVRPEWRCLIETMRFVGHVIECALASGAPCRKLHFPLCHQSTSRPRCDSSFTSS